MRKLITREEREKIRKRNSWIIGVVLIFLMVFSTFAFSFLGFSGNDSGQDQTVEYNNIKFVRNGEYWSFNLQGFDFFTRYNPEEVSDIYFLNYLTIQSYAQKPLYFVGNFEANAILENNLGPFAQRTVSPACISEEDCDGDYPVKNCSLDNVIIVEEVDYKSDYVEEIVQEENCVFIRASLTNQSRYADAFLFDMLSI